MEEIDPLSNKRKRDDEEPELPSKRRKSEDGKQEISAPAVEEDFKLPEITESSGPTCQIRVSFVWQLIILR